MDTVEEIEAAISALPLEQYRHLLHWFHSLQQRRWDERIDRDSSAGKLDFLFSEADGEPAQDLLREWSPRQ